MVVSATGIHVWTLTVKAGNSIRRSRVVRRGDIIELVHRHDLSGPNVMIGVESTKTVHFT